MVSSYYEKSPLTGTNVVRRCWISSCHLLRGHTVLNLRPINQRASYHTVSRYEGMSLLVKSTILSRQPLPSELRLPRHICPQGIEFDLNFKGSDTDSMEFYTNLHETPISDPFLDLNFREIWRRVQGKEMQDDLDLSWHMCIRLREVARRQRRPSSKIGRDQDNT